MRRLTGSGRDVLRKQRAGQGPGSLCFVAGNPLIMIRRRTVTVLIKERGDGVHTAYDLMACLIASGSEAALVIAGDLDANVESPIAA